MSLGGWSTHRVVLRANVLCVKVKLLFIYCLVLLQFASLLLSSMILIELSLYSAFTMMFQLSVLIPSLFCMLLLLFFFFFFQISSF